MVPRRGLKRGARSGGAAASRRGRRKARPGRADTLPTEMSKEKTQIQSGPPPRRTGPYDRKSRSLTPGEDDSGQQTDGKDRAGRPAKFPLAFPSGGSSVSIRLNAQRKRYESHRIKSRTGRARPARRHHSSRRPGDNPARVPSLAR